MQKKRISSVAFDPRPAEHRELTKDAIENLRCDLLTQPY